MIMVFLQVPKWEKCLRMSSFTCQKIGNWTTVIMKTYHIFLLEDEIFLLKKWLMRHNGLWLMLLQKTVLNCQSIEIQNNMWEKRIGLLIFCKNFGYRTIASIFSEQLPSKYSQLLLALTKLSFSSKSYFSATFCQAFCTASFCLKPLTLLSYKSGKPFTFSTSISCSCKHNVANVIY